MPRIIKGSPFSERLVGEDRLDDYDVIRGLGGNDILVGLKGRDALDGGAGNDRFEYLSVADDIDIGEQVEGGAGRDTIVITGVKHLDNLFTMRSIEAISFQGDSSIATSLTIAASQISKAGLSKSSDIRGSSGADTLIVNIDTGKKVNLSFFDFSRWSGNDQVQINGSKQDDTIVGSEKRDIIRGGAGADEMFGGRGNDTYYISNKNDLVHERKDGGINDAVYSSASVQKLSRNIESLTLTGTRGLSATGNGQDNVIFGNDGFNRIDGAGGDDRISGGAGGDGLLGGNGDDVLIGGRGNDTLTGGSGRDSFFLTDALSTVDNVDTIKDFTTSIDTIFLSSAVMTGLTSGGALAEAAFRIGSFGTVLDADDRIIFDSATGELLYDADGSGATAAVRFAILDGDSSVSATDFFIF